VPRVRFVLHAFFTITLLVLNILLVQGLNPLLGTTPGWLPAVEFTFYVTLLGHFHEESRQLFMHGVQQYMSSFWNKVDVVTIVLQSIALALRVVELFFSQQVGEMQQQVQFDFQVWGMLMFFIRCLEILNIHPALGEVFLIVREMIIDSFAVFFYMLVIAVWAGLALSVGQASGSYQSRYQEPIESRQWRFAGLWAIIGENLEFIDEFYELSTANRNRFNWYPFLFYITNLLTCVILVNLLIAMMTSTYERIRSESQYWRATQYCETVIEFKDERSIPPPLNLVLNPLLFFLDGFIAKRLPQSLNIRGFATHMDASAMRRVTALEQSCATAFDQESVRNAVMTSESRIAAICDRLPAVDMLLRRTEVIEEGLGTLTDMVRQQMVLERSLKEAKLSEPDGDHPGARQRTCGRARSRERGHGGRRTLLPDALASDPLEPGCPSSPSRRPSLPHHRRLSLETSTAGIGGLRTGVLPPATSTALRPIPGSCASLLAARTWRSSK